MKIYPIGHLVKTNPKRTQTKPISKEKNAPKNVDLHREGRYNKNTFRVEVRLDFPNKYL